MQGEMIRGIPAPLEDNVLDDLLSVAERIVESAVSAGAESAEAYVQTETGQSFSIEKNAIGFTSAGGEAGIGLRVMKASRMGFAYFSDPADRAATIERALQAATRAETTPYRFPGAADHPVVAGTWDHGLVDFDTEDGLDAVRALIDGARAVDPKVTVSGGSIGVGAVAAALVNSEGLEFATRATGFGSSAYVVLKSGDDVTTGFQSHETTRLDERALDPGRIGQEAAEQARATRGATPFGDGRDTTVVFHPDAAAALVEFLALPALHGDKAARGESIWSGKKGEEVVDKRFVLTDDPTREGGLGSSPADDEGLPSRRVPLLEHGRVQHFLYDLASAYEYGGGADAATASGVRSGGLSDDRTYQEAPSTNARNIVVGATDAVPLDRLIGGIDDGILVRDLLGAHTANPTSGDFSVSSTVLFAIRKGELAGPLQPVMLAGNLPRLLASAFVGCSSEREQTSGHFSPVGLEVPHLALSDVHVVGS